MNTSIKSCYFCSKSIVYKKMSLGEHILCSSLCVDKYIKNSNGIQMNCCKCNKSFTKKYLGSHIIDVHGNIHVHCCVKCQFKK